MNVPIDCATCAVMGKDCGAARHARWSRPYVPTSDPVVNATHLAESLTYPVEALRAAYEHGKRDAVRPVTDEAERALRAMEALVAKHDEHLQLRVQQLTEIRAMLRLERIRELGTHGARLVDADAVPERYRSHGWAKG